MEHGHTAIVILVSRLLNAIKNELNIIVIDDESRTLDEKNKSNSRAFYLSVVVVPTGILRKRGDMQYFFFIPRNVRIVKSNWFFS